MKSKSGKFRPCSYSVILVVFITLTDMGVVRILKGVDKHSEGVLYLGVALTI